MIDDYKRGLYERIHLTFIESIFSAENACARTAVNAIYARVRSRTCV